MCINLWLFTIKYNKKCQQNLAESQFRLLLFKCHLLLKMHKVHNMPKKRNDVFEAYARFHNSRESNICGLLLFTITGKSPPNLGQTPILMMYCTVALRFCDSLIVQCNTLSLHAKTFSQKIKMFKLASNKSSRTFLCQSRRHLIKRRNAAVPSRAKFCWNWTQLHET